MKFTLLIALLLSSIIASSQSKQETIDWINQKFSASPFLQDKVNSKVFMTHTRFLKIKDDGTFQIDCNDYYANNITLKTPDSKYQVIGNFKDLSPNSLSTKVRDDILLIYVSCSNGNCLRQINDDGTTYTVGMTLIGMLDISTDPSLVDRSKKAFLHLITLCGGKKEAF